MKLFTILLFLFLAASCVKPPQEVPAKAKPPEGEITESQYRKEMDEIKKSLKGDIKVKLKRDGKGNYTWEITGKDTQEVLKANEALRKRLGDVQ